jgi:hypothetical protein
MERASYEFHIGRAARDRFGFSDRLFSVTANVGLPRSRKTADSPP